MSEEDSSSSDESDSESEFHDIESLSGLSETSIPLDIPGHDLEAEFRTEVEQSLERAFAEGHSVDNAAVELKTLRMASNVPLKRVREAVVAAIVEKIPVVEGDMVVQKREIASILKRWGELIDRIGGVDAVETVSVLQVGFASNIFYSTKLKVCAKLIVRLTVRHQAACRSSAKFLLHYIKETSWRRTTSGHGTRCLNQREKIANHLSKQRTSRNVGL